MVFTNSTLLIFTTAVIANLLMIILFYFRLKKYPKGENITGILIELLAIPTIITLILFIQNDSELWMTIYLVIFLVFLVVELVLDYILKIEFRTNKKIVIPYVILYIISFWGLLGINFALNLMYGFIVFILYAVHTAIMIQAHKK